MFENFLGGIAQLPPLLAGLMKYIGRNCCSGHLRKKFQHTACEILHLVSAVFKHLLFTYFMYRNFRKGKAIDLTR